MPVALPESVRETVKALYFQGLKNKVIAERVGIPQPTVKNWVHKYGWNRTVTKARELSLPAIAQDLASRSQALRSELSSELHDQLAAVRSKPVSLKIKEIGTRASVVETVTRSASKVFGWGDENREVLVNVTMMSQPIPCGVLDQGVNDKVIDVDTTSENHQ